MIRIYGHPFSRSLRATWAAEEVGATYEYEKVDLYGGAARRPPYVDLNPGGKVPTLVDGDLVLTESAAIVTYLGERHPEAGLLPPAGSPARAQYDRWCFFVIGELEQGLWTIGKHSFALPEKHRVPAVIETARWEYRVAEKVLAAGLGDRSYLLGDAFSLADVLVGHTLSWAKSRGLPTEDERLLAYVKRVRGRPALAAAQAREAV